MATNRKDQAEILRKRYLYRRMVLAKKVELPHKTAADLIGPDCAYHLYRHQDNKPKT